MAYFFYLVGYDIGEPKRQAHFRQIVKNYSMDGQLSAYECWLTAKDKAQLENTINNLGDESDGYCVIKIQHIYWQNITLNSFDDSTPEFLYIG